MGERSPYRLSKGLEGEQRMLEAGLRYVYEVADLGSIRKAADRLHVSPSAISRMVAKVEEYYDVELFERHKHGMSLTAAGQILIDELRCSFFHLRQARERINDLKGLRSGDVCLYSIEGMIMEWIPLCLKGFQNRYPDIRYSVNIGSTDVIADMLLGDHADLGITYCLGARADIEVLASIEQPLHILAAPSHPIARKTIVSLRDVVEFPIAISDTTFGTRTIFERALRTLNIKRTPQLTSNSLAVNYGMARHGGSLTLSIPLACRESVANGLLVNIPVIEQQLLTGQVALCKRRGRRLSAAAIAVAELLGAQLNSMNCGPLFEVG